HMDCRPTGAPKVTGHVDRVIGGRRTVSAHHDRAIHRSLLLRSLRPLAGSLPGLGCRAQARYAGSVGYATCTARRPRLRACPFALVEALVNNAGFGGTGSFASRDRDSDLRMVAVNVVALTDLTKQLLPGMVARGRGRVLNVASTASFQPGPFMAVYYATKAYVLSLSQALAEETSGTGVTVTCLCPG